MKKLFFGLSLLFLVFTCQARIITVDDDGPADFNNIQAAIDDSNDGDVIEVQPGRYTGLGNRDIDFKGKAITIRSADPNDPNIVAATMIDCQGSGRGFNLHSGEDPNSVISGFTVMNGYATYGGGIYNYQSSPTITNCNISRNSAKRYGGGIYCRDSNPTIRNCTIRDNRSSDRCGGVYGSGGPINNCTIVGNSSIMTPGGLYKCTGLISNCTISGNTEVALLECGPISSCTISRNAGDGLGLCGPISNCIISGNSGWGLFLCSSVSNCTISGNGRAGLSGCRSVSNCVIIGNKGYKGGGLLGCYSITNCTIIGNTAEFGGGAASCGLISNCTFSNNRANGAGGAIYCFGNETTVINCILWGDTAVRGDEIALFEEISCPIGFPCEYYPSSITVNYSNVQGGPSDVYVDPNCILVWGLGNIDADPCFVNSGYWDPNGTPEYLNDDFWVDGDYHLKSQAGRWNPNSQQWVYDEVTSPCIDAGNPGCPVGDEPAPNGNRINMGAYGGTAEASKSLANWRNIADLTNDNRVDANDLQLFSQYWLGNGVNLPADLNRNQLVDFSDFAIFADNWLWP